MCKYFNSKQIPDLYNKTIEVSGGGEIGIIHNGYIDSILEHIRNDDYYPTFIDKLCHLIFSIISFHCFQDGNKRMAITLGSYFLLINGYTFVLTKFIIQMKDISIYVASGLIDKELLSEIVDSIIYEEDYNEELKLKILNCIEKTSIED